MKEISYKVETDLGQIYVDKSEFDDIKYRVNNVSPWNEDVDGNPVSFHAETQEFPNEIIIVGSTRLRGNKKPSEREVFKSEILVRINELKSLKGMGDQAKLVLDKLIEEINETP